MSLEERIDDLIEAGWYMLESDFDPIAFERWRLTALDCLSDLLGPHHTYTLYFRNRIEENDKLNWLTGGGILTAARYAAAGTRIGSAGNDGQGAAAHVDRGGRLPNGFVGSCVAEGACE